MIAVLLHMHQPDYRDPRTGAPSMPWVRLHATRGYRDVPWIVKTTGARLTINLVPSLIDQWEHYRGGGEDPHLALCRRRADTLLPGEVAWMLENFFHGNPGAFRWFPAWGELRARRDAHERFDVAAVRDVMVWSNLAWFGFSALRDHPELRELRRKASGFTEEEKEHVLAVQRTCIDELVALHRDLPEVSCSPYFHPILPLLIDTAHASRCLPGVPDPGFRHPEDARDQLVAAQDRLHAWVGRRPVGLWPSEGSVSPEVVELAANLGFRWIATDEEVLRRSERSGAAKGADHHGPWTCGGTRLVFRDHGLSDRIGFTYATWRGEEAAKDLLQAVGDRPVLLALDGENPWEAFRDAGEHFLRAFLGSGRTTTVAELAEGAPVGHIARVHTGSWIGGDFAIWIGHPEDREAWALLRDARAAWERHGKPEAARRHLQAAEGSDWFWWYGDQFSTPFEGEFDRLFRAHLAAAWAAMGEPVPAVLARPIKRSGRGVIPPKGPLGPDGDDWFAWAPAGRVDLRAGAMAPVAGLPRALLFGERNGRLQLRLVPGGEGWSAESEGERVPFVRGRVEVPGSRVVLHGPGGLRVPGEGSLELPIGEGGPVGAA